MLLRLKFLIRRKPLLLAGFFVLIVIGVLAGVVFSRSDPAVNVGLASTSQAKVLASAAYSAAPETVATSTIPDATTPPQSSGSISKKTQVSPGQTIAPPSTQGQPPASPPSAPPAPCATVTEWLNPDVSGFTGPSKMNIRVNCTGQTFTANSVGGGELEWWANNDPDKQPPVVLADFVSGQHKSPSFSFKVQSRSDAKVGDVTEIYILVGGERMWSIRVTVVQ